MNNSEVLEVWNQLLRELEKKVNNNSFETLQKSLKPLGFYKNTLIIETPNYFSRDWLNDRFSVPFKEVLQKIFDREIEVKFLTNNEIPEDVSIANQEPQVRVEATPISFNPKYRFENFIIGNSNRFAHAACFAVADSPSMTYNPLFLYGGAGLGKTHLMQAIGHHILSKFTDKKVAYVTSETFTNELINSIKDNNTNEFRNKYRNMDILLIDDIQFLAGKESTQEEFFHTFNTLYEDNSQIIISSDRPPKEIPTLEERLRSRFEWGLISDIQPPDLETRIAILRKKGQMENINVPDDTISYIADNIHSNIRVLEGAFTKVVAHAQFYNEEINQELATEVLKDILSPERPTKITIELIQKVVTEYFNIRLDELKSKRRTSAISYPRHIAMYITKELLPDISLPKIGKNFGDRDHTTVIHACNKINNKMKDDTTLQNDVSELIKRITTN